MLYIYYNIYYNMLYYRTTEIKILLFIEELTLNLWDRCVLSDFDGF